MTSQKYKDNWDVRCASLVNNQIGYVNAKLNDTKFYIKLIKRELEENTLKQKIQKPFNDKNLKEVVIVDDFLDYEIVKESRNFLNNIPKNEQTRPLNHLDNLPKDNIFDELKSGDSLIFYNMIEDKEKITSNDWTYEYYLEGQIWRICANNLSAHYNSPIYKLLNKLEQKIDMMCGILFEKKLRKGTWVLQRICKDNAIFEHTDEGYSRKLAFCFYLSPDEWDKSTNGGELEIMDSNNNWISIDPKFNRVVCWPIYDTSEEGKINIPHRVNKVLKECNVGGRFSVVGFMH